MNPVVCSVDLGSSVIKAAIVDSTGEVLFAASRPAPEVSAQDGSFDPDDYAAAVTGVLSDLNAGADGLSRRVEGISFSSQRATLVTVDGSREPLGPAISWMGSSCTEAANEFYSRIGPEVFHRVTGLPPSFIYTAAKLAHRKAVANGSLAVGEKYSTLHEHIVGSLGGEDHMVDHSNASATGLYDIESRGWSAPILDELGIGVDALPRIVPAGTPAGKLCASVATMTGFTAGTPLFVGGGDQQCANLGAASSTPGRCVLSLGTAAVAMATVEQIPEHRSNALLLLSAIPADRWQVEGFMNAYGSCVNWWSEVNGCGSAAELEELATEAGDDDVMFLPFLSGIGTPDQEAGVRGAFLGLGSGTGKAQMARGVLVGLACETRRLIDTLSRAVPVERLTVVGGGRGRGLMRRMLADAVGLPLDLARDQEAAIRGAAALAWCGVRGDVEPHRVFEDFVGEEPESELGSFAGRERMEKLYDRYCASVSALISLRGGEAQ